MTDQTSEPNTPTKGVLRKKIEMGWVALCVSGALSILLAQLATGLIFLGEDPSRVLFGKLATTVFMLLVFVPPVFYIAALLRKWEITLDAQLPD